jgi:uncharacterized protein with NRDE domain
VCTALIVRTPGSLVVAANRDEFLRRPAVGPTVLVDRPRAVGGLDLEQRGSWLGVSAAGTIALLTNLPEPGGPRPDRRSRGELVMEVLRRGGGDDARAWLAGVDGRDYNGFNLLVGDAGRADVFHGRPDRAGLEVVAVPAGFHVLPNGTLDQDGHIKVARARALLGADRERGPRLEAALLAALADHERPALASLAEPAAGARFSREEIRELSALCIHTPAYGTRSAAFVHLVPGGVAALRWASGPPCRTPFVDAAPLLG